MRDCPCPTRHEPIQLSRDTPARVPSPCAQTPRGHKLRRRSSAKLALDGGQRRRYTARLLETSPKAQTALADLRPRLPPRDLQPTDLLTSRRHSSRSSRILARRSGQSESDR